MFILLHLFIFILIFWSMTEAQKRRVAGSGATMLRDRLKLDTRLAILLLCFLSFMTGFEPATALRACVPRRYQLRSDVSCVCNATYCDDFPPLGQLNANEAVIYRSTIAGDRFLQSRNTFRLVNDAPNATLSGAEHIDVDGSISIKKRFQKIIGFGGAFTDSAGINLNRLSQNARDNLVRSYYANNGIGYSLGRVPMASCDFSARVYSYCDTPGDFNLSTFSLTDEDLQLKIPFIKAANAYVDLKLYASPWSAPGWMKESGKMVGGTKLKQPFNGKYYLTWANYFRRFFEEYIKQGIKFWGLTVQNEPTAGVFEGFPFQSMYYTPTMLRDFIAIVLGPHLKSHDLTKSLKIMAHDDQRYFLPLHADVILGSQEAANFIDGIAVHWYGDALTDAKRLTTVHERYPDKFILGTEASSGYVPFFLGPVFGDWYRGEEYARRIIDDLENWVAGWTDWNLCLDEGGGPNFAKNFVDSPIIVNNTVDEFYKQPMYYAMGHFSKFIRPGSVRIGVKLKQKGLVANSHLSATAFLNPQNHVVVVLLNRHYTNRYEIHFTTDFNTSEVLDVTVEPNSIVTVVWRAGKNLNKQKKKWRKHNRTNIA